MCVEKGMLFRWKMEAQGFTRRQEFLGEQLHCKPGRGYLSSERGLAVQKGVD